MSEVPLCEAFATQLMWEQCGSWQLLTICRKVNFRRCVEKLRAAQFFFLSDETHDDIVGTDPNDPSCCGVGGSGFGVRGLGFRVED